MRPRTALSLAGAAVLFAAFGVCLARFDGWQSGIPWAEPPVVTPGTNGSAPSDATVLFDGKDLTAWENDGKGWEVADGAAVPRRGDIRTKGKFGDCKLHLEFAMPEKAEGSGQGRGNSGVYLMDRYEVQILDSYDNKTYFDGQCGSVYKQSPPMVNACRKPGEWQTYDIVFEAPQFGPDGKVQKPAYVTVIHNGIVVQNHLELKGATDFLRPPSYSKHEDKEPIHLQFHGNPVRFRNIWIRPIAPPAQTAKPA